MWAIQLVGYLFLGFAVVLSVVFALPYMITKAAQHDQATCDCWDCKNRRHRAVQKAVKRRGGFYPDVSSQDEKDPKNYWTTEELRHAYYVFVKGKTYEIMGLKGNSQTGQTIVTLQNVLTRGMTQVKVDASSLTIKMWRKGFEP